MFIEQSNLFPGMDRDFVKRVMDLTEKHTFTDGQFLFHEEDPATHFYILLKGRVKLVLGKVGQVIHVVSNAGEAFGWSSLVGREAYSLSAECKAPTTLLRIEGESFRRVLEEDPANGLIFYSRLAETLGRRLILSYGNISASAQAGTAPSLGTGQLAESMVAN